MARPSVAVVAGVLVGIAGSLVFAPLPAAAADGDTVTWSLTPADANGADGRAVIERSLDPGDTFQDFVQLKNFGSSPVTFVLEAADGYYTDTSRFAMRERGQQSTDLGTWISLPDSVTVAASSNTVVPFTVTVPSDAVPGDHVAGIAASISSAPAGAAQNGSISVDARVGVAMAVHVSGELRAQIAATVTADYGTNLNPFLPGTLTLEYTVINTGNIIVAVDGDATASGPFDLLAHRETLARIDRLGPGEQRTESIVLEGVWPTFTTNAHISLTVTPVTAAGTPPAAHTETTTALSVPYPQAAVAAAGALLILLYALDRRRQRRKMAAAITEAHRRGLHDRDSPSAP